MNTTRRVPGITRNSGWQAVDAEIHLTRGTSSKLGSATTAVGTEWADSNLDLTTERGVVIARVR